MTIEICDCVAQYFFNRDCSFDEEEEAINEELSLVKAYIDRCPEGDHFSYDKYSALFCRLSDELYELRAARDSFYHEVAYEFLSQLSMCDSLKRFDCVESSEEV